MVGYSIFEYFEDYVLPILEEIVANKDLDTYEIFMGKIRALFSDQDNSPRGDYYQNCFRKSLLTLATGEDDLEAFLQKAIELFSHDDDTIRIKKIVVERDGKEITIDYKDLDGTEGLKNLLSDTKFIEMVSERIISKLNPK